MAKDSNYIHKKKILYKQILTIKKNLPPPTEYILYLARTILHII